MWRYCALMTNLHNFLAGSDASAPTRAGNQHCQSDDAPLYKSPMDSAFSPNSWRRYGPAAPIESYETCPQRNHVDRSHCAPWDNLGHYTIAANDAPVHPVEPCKVEPAGTTSIPRYPLRSKSGDAGRISAIGIFARAVHLCDAISSSRNADGAMETCVGGQAPTCAMQEHARTIDSPRARASAARIAHLRVDIHRTFHCPACRRDRAAASGKRGRSLARPRRQHSCRRKGACCETAGGVAPTATPSCTGPRPDRVGWLGLAGSGAAGQRAEGASPSSRCQLPQPLCERSL